MVEIEIWIAIGTITVTVIGIILEFRLYKKKNERSFQTLAEIININRKQLELLDQEISEKITIERERFQFEKYKQQYEEKWKQLEALGRIGKFILESDLD